MWVPKRFELSQLTATTPGARLNERRGPAAFFSLFDLCVCVCVDRQKQHSRGGVPNGFSFSFFEKKKKKKRAGERERELVSPGALLQAVSHAAETKYSRFFPFFGTKMLLLRRTAGTVKDKRGIFGNKTVL